MNRSLAEGQAEIMVHSRTRLYPRIVAVEVGADKQNGTTSLNSLKRIGNHTMDSSFYQEQILW